MNAWVFAGQGSQKRGMGSDLFDKYEGLVEKADSILGYSIKELCLKNPDNRLIRTEYTQPALFFVNTLLYLEKIAKEKKPDFLAGHSLGEYNALFAAGVFDIETSLRIVKKRGELMAEAQNGGMAAVIGIKSDALHAILKQNNLGSIDIANYNSCFQTVISGPAEDIHNASAIFENAGARYIPLAV
ncbi:MAG: acyltransferase domain-containing protein, partial [Chitinivibrionales bacterium]|nr:acyltransferase domain-containing protein [Chitinivibrionales bacterium]